MSQNAASREFENGRGTSTLRRLTVKVDRSARKETSGWPTIHSLSIQCVGQPESVYLQYTVRVRKANMESHMAKRILTVLVPAALL
jgi:hypothetical protein